MMANIIKIDGSWDADFRKGYASMNISQSGGAFVGTFRDSDQTKIGTYTEDDEVEIYHSATKIWGGYITDMKYVGVKKLRITAEDYASRLNRKISKVYITDSAGDPADDTGQVSNIVTDLLTIFPEFTTSITATSKVIDRFRIDYIGVKEALKKLADLVAYDFWITPGKVFTFKPKTTITAASDTAVWGTNIIKADKGRTIKSTFSQIIIVGGEEIQEQTDTFTGDASTKEFSLTYAPDNPLTHVKVTGAAKTEWADYQVNYETGDLHFETAPPSAADNVEVKYNYRKIITAEASDTSVAYTKRTEKVYEKSIQDKSIAQDYADALLADKKTKKTSYKVVCRDIKDTTIKQYLTTTIPKYSLSAESLEVRSWRVDIPKFKYTVELSWKDTELAQMLATLQSEVKEMQISSTGTTITYKTKNETVTVTDTGSTAYTRQVNTTFILGLCSNASALGLGSSHDVLQDKRGDRVEVT